jgi:hypothetical protein
MWTKRYSPTVGQARRLLSERTDECVRYRPAGALTERPGYRPGFIGLITPDGTVRQVADGIDFPNGWSSRRTTRR